MPDIQGAQSIAIYKLSTKIDHNEPSWESIMGAYCVKFDLYLLLRKGTVKKIRYLAEKGRIDENDIAPK